jgi:hypothetical protein
MSKPKGIGYAHRVEALTLPRGTVRRICELVEASRGILHILEPLDGPEKKAILRFKRAIERFEKAAK